MFHNNRGSRTSRPKRLRLSTDVKTSDGCSLVHRRDHLRGVGSLRPLVSKVQWERCRVGRSNEEDGVLTRIRDESDLSERRRGVDTSGVKSFGSRFVLKGSILY